MTGFCFQRYARILYQSENDTRLHLKINKLLILKVRNDWESWRAPVYNQVDPEHMSELFGVTERLM